MPGARFRPGRRTRRSRRPGRAADRTAIPGPARSGTRPAARRRRSGRGELRGTPLLLHGTHASQVEDAGRADVGEYPGLLLLDGGQVDLARGETGRLETASAARLGLDGVDRWLVVCAPAGMGDVVGAAAARGPGG